MSGVVSKPLNPLHSIVSMYILHTVCVAVGADKGEFVEKSGKSCFSWRVIISLILVTLTCASGVIFDG